MEQKLNKEKKRQRKWTGREKKEISFTKDKKELLEYLDNMDNVSRYVIELVEQDLAKKDKECNLDEVIQRLDRIERILSNGPQNPKSCDLGDKVLKSIKVFMDDED